MVTPVSEALDLELSGEGYNVMLQHPDKFGNFKVDLVVSDPDEIAKLEQYAKDYGLKVKDTVTFPTADGLVTKTNVKTITIRAPFVEGGKYPRKFIPTRHSGSGEVVTDLISHGAKLTIVFRVYGYPAGTNKQGQDYPGGNGFQLRKVAIHEYTPYVATESKQNATA